MPTITKLAGWAHNSGQMWCSTMPNAPPPQPPMTIEGPNTPPEPPLPIVKAVVKILPIAIANSTAARPRLASPLGGTFIASWRAP